MIDSHKKYRIAFLISHPIQYQIPLFRQLALHPDIDLTVFYCSRHGAQNKRDDGFGVSFKWDINMLDGYRSVFLKNYSPLPSVDKPLGLFNPSIVLKLMCQSYDVLIVHGYTHVTHILAFCAAFALNLPVFFRGETVIRPPRNQLFERLKNTYLRTLFSRIHAFLTIGTISHQFYTSFNIPERKLFFTPYSVDNDFFILQAEKFTSKVGATKERLGLPMIPLILFVGKLIRRKRPNDLLSAFSLLPTGKASLVFVGDGDLRQELEKTVKREKIENVRFVGFQNQTQIGEYYSAADILVLPSEREVSPLVFNEAMCFHLPLVASDAIPSSCDFIEHGVNGYIFPLGDILKLTEYLEKLITDPSKRRVFGEISFKKVSSWTVQACVDGIYSALKTLPL